MTIKNLTTLLMVLLVNWGFTQANLVITEIMYNPPEAGTDTTEFIEIYNNSSQSINLTNYTCTGGNYTFPEFFLPSGGYYVIAVSTSGFTNTYGFAPHGEFIGGLSNSGESIVLKDSLGVMVDSVNYDDVAPWPVGSSLGMADGGGASLELCAPNSDNNIGSNWNASVHQTGLIVNGSEVLASPGLANFCCPILESSQTIVECLGYTITVGTNTYSETGLYTDLLTGSAGCDSIVTTDLTIIVPTSSVISETSCGSFLSPSGNYTWTASNTYMDTVPNAVGCDSVITVNLTINSSNVAVNQTSNILTVEENGAVYQWLNCSGLTAISGAIAQSYTALENGDYAVIVFSNGCSDTSECLNVASADILDKYTLSDITIYPNPTSDRVMVGLSSSFSTLSYYLFAADGKKVSTGTINSALSFDLDLSDEEDGIYFLHLTLDDKLFVQKIVKQ